MITSSLLVSLLVFILIVALIWWVLNAVGLPPLVQKVASIVLVIFAVLWLIDLISPGTIAL